LKSNCAPRAGLKFQPKQIKLLQIFRKQPFKARLFAVNFLFQDCMNLTNGMGLTSLACLLGSSLAIWIQPAHANVSPCTSISNPIAGTLCFYDHPWNMRQRDEGGTKNVQFITERQSGGWVIENHQVIRGPGGHGTIQEPVCDAVSGTGVAEISRESSRSIDRLNEIKAKLKAKVTIIKPPLKGEAEKEIDAISREIEKISESQSSFVSKGGNEALKCTGSTHVSCQKIPIYGQVCGQGAAASGVVRITRRYLGDPIKLFAAAREAEQRGNTLVAKIEATPPDPIVNPVKEPIINKQQPKQNEKELAQKQCFNMFFTNHKALAQCIQLVNTRY